MLSIYSIHTKLYADCQIDADGNGDVTLAELTDLVVNKTGTANWNAAIQFFVQSFDTEEGFKVELVKFDSDFVMIYICNDLHS